MRIRIQKNRLKFPKVTDEEASRNVNKSKEERPTRLWHFSDVSESFLVQRPTVDH